MKKLLKPFGIMLLGIVVLALAAGCTPRSQAPQGADATESAQVQTQNTEVVSDAPAAVVQPQAQNAESENNVGVTATPLTDFEIDGTTLEKYNGNGGDVVIPNGITQIWIMAFYESQLTSVTIPDSVTIIGVGSFMGNQLSSVTIPDSVTDIGSNAFTNNQLTSINIPSSVTYIGYGAFSGNPLNDITIPDSSDVYIGYFAFEKEPYYDEW